MRKSIYEDYRKVPRANGESPGDWLARVRAAREFTNRVPRNGNDQRALEFVAFMALFHPEVDEGKVYETAREIRRRKD